MVRLELQLCTQWLKVPHGQSFKSEGLYWNGPFSNADFYYGCKRLLNEPHAYVIHFTNSLFVTQPTNLKFVLLTGH